MEWDEDSWGQHGWGNCWHSWDGWGAGWWGGWSSRYANQHEHDWSAASDTESSRAAESNHSSKNSPAESNRSSKNSPAESNRSSKNSASPAKSSRSSKNSPAKSPVKPDAQSKEIQDMLNRPLTKVHEFEELEAEAAKFDKELEMELQAELAKDKDDATTLRSLDTQTTLPWTASQLELPESPSSGKKSREAPADSVEATQVQESQPQPLQPQPRPETMEMVLYTAPVAEKPIAKPAAADASQQPAEPCKSQAPENLGASDNEAVKQKPEPKPAAPSQAKDETTAVAPQTLAKPTATDASQQPVEPCKTQAPENLASKPSEQAVAAADSGHQQKQSGADTAAGEQPQPIKKEPAEETKPPAEIDKSPEEKWRRDKFGRLLTGAALYARFFRSARSGNPSYVYVIRN